MTEQEAWWILRAEIVLAWEGRDVSAYEAVDGDEEIIDEALKLAGDKISEHDQWVFPSNPA